MRTKTTLFSIVKILALLFSTQIMASGSYRATALDENGNELERFYSSTESAILCSNTETDFTGVHLWMQMGDHGHGTSPVTTIQLDGYCIQINDIDFVMAGMWQIRFTTKTGKNAISIRVHRD